MEQLYHVNPNPETFNAPADVNSRLTGYSYNTGGCRVFDLSEITKKKGAPPFVL